MTPTGQRILWTIASLIVAGVVTVIPGARVWIAAQLDRLRQPSPRGRRATAVVVFVVSVAYMLLTAWLQDRDLVPKFHDEFMHLLQMRMLAVGKLWTVSHPLADFFETFHVLVRPVYASIYWPGTALLYVATIWLKLPYWVGPLMVAGASVALMYRVTAELIDGAWGIVAAILLVSLDTFRFLSLVMMSHGAIIMMGLAIVWAYLRWREQHAFGWAMVAGALIGWAAITRPVDAIAFTLPVAIAVMIELRQMAMKRALVTLMLALVAAAPLVMLQLIEDVGVTGKLFDTPYAMYAREDSPNLQMGFGAVDPNAKPQSRLLQKQLFYEKFLLPEIEAHTWSQVPRKWIRQRIPLLINVTLPSVLLVALVPFGLLALRDRRWVLGAMWMVYCVLYVWFPYLLRQYAVVAAPSILFCVVAGAAWIAARLGERGRVAMMLAIALLAIAHLPELDRDVLDDGYPRPTMWFVAKEMPAHVKTPAIVLFRFRAGDELHEEPVYNVDAVNPDDELIIRAHDLGRERDRELFDYYAKRQPEREVYLYDRALRAQRDLGNVVDLARRFPLTPATASTSTTTALGTTATTRSVP